MSVINCERMSSDYVENIPAPHTLSKRAYTVVVNHIVYPTTSTPFCKSSWHNSRRIPAGKLRPWISNYICYNTCQGSTILSLETRFRKNNEILFFVFLAVSDNVTTNAVFYRSLDMCSLILYYVDLFYSNSLLSISVFFFQ